MEGSALGVPRDEVGLGEQWELLLLLQELWVLEPAMRWTTGFWAKSTPGRRREGERSISKLSDPINLILAGRGSARDGQAWRQIRGSSGDRDLRRNPPRTCSGTCHRGVVLMEGKDPKWLQHLWRREATIIALW